MKFLLLFQIIIAALLSAGLALLSAGCFYHGEKLLAFGFAFLAFSAGGWVSVLDARYNRIFR